MALKMAADRGEARKEREGRGKRRSDALCLSGPALPCRLGVGAGLRPQPTRQAGAGLGHFAVRSSLDRSLGGTKFQGKQLDTQPVTCIPPYLELFFSAEFVSFFVFIFLLGFYFHQYKHKDVIQEVFGVPNF